MGSNSTDVPSGFLAQVERRDIAVENCDAKNERMANEKEEEKDHLVEAKSDQAEGLQIQIQPQIQQTDAQADR